MRTCTWVGVWVGMVLGWLLAAGEVRGEELAALDLPVGGMGGGASQDHVVGWEFDLDEPVTVRQLAVLVAKVEDGLPEDAPVAIWGADKTLLVQAVIPSGKTGSRLPRHAPFAGTKSTWEFRAVAVEPVTLPAGSGYVIGTLVREGSKGFRAGVNYGPAGTTLGPIRYVRPRFGFLSKGMDFPEQRSTAGERSSFGQFGPNFAVEATDSLRAKALKAYQIRPRQQPSISEMHVSEIPSEQAAIPFSEQESLKVPTILLFSRSDGELTQILYRDEPFGSNKQTFDELTAKIVREWKVGGKPRPAYRFVLTPGVRASDLFSAMKAATFEMTGQGGIGGGEVVPMEFARPIHASKNGKYIVPDRFRDAGEYIEDKWTGLLWQKDGNTIPQKNYQQAMDYARKAKLWTVKTGWRVPTAAEFTTIYPANFEPFKNTGYKEWDVKDPVPAEARNYWTSELDTRQKDYAYVYHWYGPGGPNNCTASQNFVNVRLVHDALGKR